jgi:hypothetical protein
MKISIYCIVGLSIFINCIGNTTGDHCKDTVSIKGLYLIKFNKSEIVFSFKNESLRKEGKAYEKMIDFEKEAFFLPIGDSKNDIVDTINNWNPFDQKNIYFLPINQKSKGYLEKFCPEKAALTKFINFSNQSFYMMKGDENHLYSICYIEGYAIELKLENNELNKIKLDLSDEISEDRKTFNVHFIYELTNIAYNKEISDFTLWEYK